MLSSVFLRTIRDGRIAILWITVGAFIYVGVIDSLWPAVEANIAAFAGFIAILRDTSLFDMLGVSPQELTTPAGFLSARAFSWLVPVGFAIYAAGLGAASIAGEEEHNTIDLLLANPISRTRLLLEKYAAMVALMAAASLGLFAAVVTGDAIWKLDVPTANYVGATVQAFLLGLAYGSIAFAAGALGARRPLIFGLISLLVVFSFLLYAIGGIFDWLDQVRVLSPFYYYAENRPLFQGISWFNSGVLAGISVVSLAVSIYGFRRRDLAV